MRWVLREGRWLAILLKRRADELSVADQSDARDHEEPWIRCTTSCADEPEYIVTSAAEAGGRICFRQSMREEEMAPRRRQRWGWCRYNPQRGPQRLRRTRITVVIRNGRSRQDGEGR